MSERIGKGSNTRACLCDYTVIDLETTGTNINTCEVIEMAAVRVRGGEIAERFSTLVRPEHEIPAIVTRITGISSDMVTDAPSCREALRQFLAFIGNDTIVGHNIQTFDSNIIYDLSLKHFGLIFRNHMVDTMQFAKYCDLNVSGVKLTTLTAYFGIEHTHAHRALADCIANYQCYEKMKPLLTDQVHIQSSNSSSAKRYGTKPSKTTQDLLELLVLVQNIASDQALSDHEIVLLGLWMEAHKELQGNYPYDVISKKLSEILEDRIVTDDEREALLALLDEQADPVQHHAEACGGQIDFDGKLVCLTGEFDCGSRADVEKRLEQVGAVIAKAVTGKTDYLIVGGSGSAAWAHGNYGTKVKKALELQEKGKPVKIIREDVAFSSMKTDTACEEITDSETDDRNAFDPLVFNYEYMISEIQKLIKYVSEELNLPDGFLKLIENQKSHSLWIFEPVTKTKSQMILSVSQRGKADERYGRIEVKKAIIERAHAIDFKINERDPSMCYYDSKYSTVFSFLYPIVRDCAERFVPSEKFGCCGKYRECSAAGKCLHANQFYAKACWYRKNLESGKIFY